LIFSRGHLERVLGDFIDHYHHGRPHQGLEQRLPCPSAESRTSLNEHEFVIAGGSGQQVMAAANRKVSYSHAGGSHWKA
jgi:hypothetical protein